jgi:uncharacterized DUF497 family protein
MSSEWDEAKREANIQKHDVDFVLAAKIFDGRTVEALDTRRDYGEPRIGAYGVAEEIVLFVIYTWRGNRRRLISARKAGAYERLAYYAQTSGPDR